jgi:hypothetical protein
MKTVPSVPRLVLMLGLTLAAVSCGDSAPPDLSLHVTSLADDGEGSLRRVLAGAKEGETLKFTVTGQVDLLTPISIARPVTLLAAGVTLDAGKRGRALEVAAGAVVTVKGAVFQNGVGTKVSLPGQPEVAWTRGGLLLNGGDLTLDGVTVQGGAAGEGGGVYNAAGATLRLVDSAVQGNTASLVAGQEGSGAGGGVASAGTLTMESGRVSGNTGEDRGGGVFSAVTGVFELSGGNINDNRCTVPRLPKQGCGGGGVYNNGAFTMTGGQIGGNTATWFGAGVVSRTDKARFVLRGGVIENNRFAPISPEVSEDVYTYGAGVYTNNLLMEGGALRGNQALQGFGGGLVSEGPLELRDGVIEKNVAGVGGGAFLFDGGGHPAPVISGGSIQGNAAQGRPAAGKLKALRGDGGGLTFGGMTLALSGGKVADNTASDGGGGARIYSDGKLLFTGGQITGNQAARTGGGVLNGGTFDLGGGSVTGNRVSQVEGGEGGGGVRNYAGTLMTFSSGTISGNSAPYGGGVKNDHAYQTSPDAAFSMTGGTISGNMATHFGGGGVTNNGRFELSAGQITGNTAKLYGGGIANEVDAVKTFIRTGGDVSGNAPDQVHQSR